MKHQHNYVPTPVPLILDTKLTGNDKLVLIYLAWRQGSHEKTWPGIRTIARQIGIVPSTVQLCINKLVHLGYLSRYLKRVGRSFNNEYIVHLTHVPKIGTSAYRKSVQNYNTVNRTDPVFEEPVGQKAGATRKNHVKKTMRRLRKESNTRVGELRSAKQHSKQPKTKKPPNKETNHDTE
ncbi:hypothetical protein ES705_13978 [subsurface metagenome]